MQNHRQENPQSLEPLAAQATDYALHMMRTTDSVPPTVIADTDEGYVFCMPSNTNRGTCSTSSPKTGFRST